MIGLFLNNVRIKNSIILILLLSDFVIFTFYPTHGDIISLVTGTNRLVFTFCCLLICVCFYKMTLKFPKILHYRLTFLGKISYSVYLFHPIVWQLTGIFSTHFYYISKPVSVVVSVIFTLITSRYVYLYFEKYFIKLGQPNKIANTLKTLDRNN